MLCKGLSLFSFKREQFDPKYITLTVAWQNNAKYISDISACIIYSIIFFIPNKMIRE